MNEQRKLHQEAPKRTVRFPPEFTRERSDTYGIAYSLHPLQLCNESPGLELRFADLTTAIVTTLVPTVPIAPQIGQTGL